MGPQRCPEATGQEVARSIPSSSMLDHLIDLDPELDDEPVVVCAPTYAEAYQPLKGADPGTTLKARLEAGQTLSELSETDPVVAGAVARAGIAPFLVGSEAQDMSQGAALLTDSGVVAHARALLSQFDYEFLADAAKIRNLCVTTLIEETQGPKAVTRLKAVELLGKVTEVGLFTDRVAHSMETMPEAELDRKITEKLARMTGVTTVKPRKAPVETAEDIESVVEEVFSAVNARKKAKKPSEEAPG